MAEWEALVGDDYLYGGIRLIWRREIPGGGAEYTNGSTGWIAQPGDEAVLPNVKPLLLRDEQARVLLAALLRHFNGADDARMLRKDYDAERARVDKFIDALLKDIHAAG